MSVEYHIYGCWQEDHVFIFWSSRTPPVQGMKATSHELYLDRGNFSAFRNIWKIPYYRGVGVAQSI